MALLPLLRKQVTVRKFTLSQTTANYLDTAAQFGLRAQIGKLILKADDIDLKRRVAGITSVELSQGDVSLSTGESRPTPPPKIRQQSPGPFKPNDCGSIRSISGWKPGRK